MHCSCFVKRATLCYNNYGHKLTFCFKVNKKQINKEIQISLRAKTRFIIVHVQLKGNIFSLKKKSVKSY